MWSVTQGLCVGPAFPLRVLPEEMRDLSPRRREQDPHHLCCSGLAGQQLRPQPGPAASEGPRLRRAPGPEPSGGSVTIQRASAGHSTAALLAASPGSRHPSSEAGAPKWRPRSRTGRVPAGAWSPLASGTGTGLGLLASPAGRGFGFGIWGFAGTPLGDLPAPGPSGQRARHWAGWCILRPAPRWDTRGPSSTSRWGSSRGAGGPGLPRVRISPPPRAAQQPAAPVPRPCPGSASRRLIPQIDKFQCPDAGVTQAHWVLVSVTQGSAPRGGGSRPNTSRCDSAPAGVQGGCAKRYNSMAPPGGPQGSPSARDWGQKEGAPVR